MLKKLSIFLITLFVIFAVNISFADNIDSNNLTEEETNRIQQYQEDVKRELLEEVEKYYDSISNFYNYGAIYWEGDILVLGLKKTNNSYKGISNSEIFDQLNRTFNSSDSNVKIIDISYTSDELLILVDKVWDLYLEYGDANNLLDVGTLDDVGKVEINVNKDNEEARLAIEKNFGNSVIFTVNEGSEKPEPEIARKRDWTVLGGGIAGARSSGGSACTMTGIGVKDGVHYLITAGHCVTSLRSNYY